MLHTLLSFTKKKGKKNIVRRRKEEGNYVITLLIASFGSESLSMKFYKPMLYESQQALLSRALSHRFISYLGHEFNPMRRT